jgi:hypothetical protein
MCVSGAESVGECFVATVLLLHVRGTSFAKDGASVTRRPSISVRIWEY